MRAIDRKLLRELSRLKGQIATIAIVLASGIASFIMLRGTYDCLLSSRDTYYDRYRFAHLFMRLERAPESLLRNIETLPGVASVQTRIAKEVMLPVEGMALPAYGQVLSVPTSGQAEVNAIQLEQGRFPGHGRDDEAVVIDSFAKAHGLLPGALLPAVINGKLKRLKIVGIGLSPEFVFVIRPGAMVEDPKRIAVLWMDRKALATAFRLEGAFNDLAIRLEPGALEAEVESRLLRLLRPYGGDQVIRRKDQISNRILTGELGQLGGIAGMVPIVFLGVTVFLIRLVLGRLIDLGRGDIATLKAIGYSNWEVGRHYLGLVLVVMVPGSLLGVLCGVWLGQLVLAMYAKSFRFPELVFRLSPSLVFTALALSFFAALLGALVAVRAAVKLPPAEAMRPAAPAKYRRSLVERLGFAAFFGPNGMMVFRELRRRPLKSVMSALGMAGAVSLVIFGRFGLDSVEEYLDGTVRREQRQDLAVLFTRPLARRALGELAQLPGVTLVEGTRAVSIKVRRGHKSRDSVLIGLPFDGSLRHLVGRGGRQALVAPDGVLVSQMLAHVLGLGLGERVEVEVREGERKVVRPFIAGFLDDAVGLQMYARQELVDTLEGHEGTLSGALLSLDPSQIEAVTERLRRSPNVLDVSDLHADIERQRQMHLSVMNTWTMISVIMGMTVIFGVVYNNARIALTARSRELASLRVLGFTRQEISLILLGGLGVEVALGIPIGLVLGRFWAQAFMGNIDPETFRWSATILPRTYALAAGATIMAAALSAFWVRRSLDSLDLVGVLKTRE